jgi:Transposase IS66 family
MPVSGKGSMATCLNPLRRRVWDPQLLVRAGHPEVPGGGQVRAARARTPRVFANLIQRARIPGPKNSTAQHPGRELLEFCRDREDDVPRFTTDTRVWPTNNISERGVRPNKTQQKVPGRLTSEDPTQDLLDTCGYIDTGRKHGRNVMTILHDLFHRKTPGSRGQQPQPPKSRRTQTAPYHHPHMGECSPGYLPPARSMNDPVT